jgi:hypothetical protein
VDLMLLLKAAVMGVVEGLTEFLPISSTGHLILAGALLGFDDDKAKVFDIAIQTGAILAVIIVYWQKISSTVRALPRSADAQRFALNVFIAFVPAVILGLLFGKAIKANLFTPEVVATTFIIGGFIILWAERRQASAVRIAEVEDMRWQDALKVGLGAVPGHDSGHQPQRRDHHWRHVAGHVAQGGDGLFFLPGHPYVDWRGGLQPVQRPRFAQHGRCAHVCGGSVVLVFERLGVRALAAQVHLDQQLRGVCLVPDRVRSGGAGHQLLWAGDLGSLIGCT